jgi:peptidoglycan hydrolase CwlO-like protein
MANITKDQAKLLARHFASFALSVSVFKFNNFNQLTDEELSHLSRQQRKLENLSQDFIENIESITGQINETTIKLKKIQKVIDVFASVLELGAAIVAKDPKLIVKKIQGLTDMVKADPEVTA